jgi:hypothetical protein
MIKVTPASFLAVSEDMQTSTKVGLLTVNYQTSLGTKEVEGKQVPQGFIGSYVFNEQGTNIFQVQKIEEDTDPKFVGKNVLEVLTANYITELKKLNPTIDFTNTFIPQDK